MVLLFNPTTNRHWMHALMIFLEQFQVGSHCLWVETNHRIIWGNRSANIAILIRLRQRSTSSLGDPSIMRLEDDFLLPVYGISNSPSKFFHFPNQRCLALYMKEALGLRSHLAPSRPGLINYIFSL